MNPEVLAATEYGCMLELIVRRTVAHHDLHLNRSGARPGSGSSSAPNATIVLNIGVQGRPPYWLGKEKIRILSVPFQHQS